MARVTAEDCSKIIPDRFQLVVYATKYAKLLNSKIEVDQSRKKHDKPTVIALRQIASGKITVAQLEQDLINSLRTTSRVEPLVNEDEAENLDEKLDYLPEVYIGEDYSDLDDQIFIDDSSEEYEKN